MAQTESTPRPPFSPRHWPMWAALALMWIGAQLPWSWQRGLGHVLGRLAPALMRDRHRAARVNLQLCFPDMPEAQREQLLRDSFDALGVGLFEFIRAWWGRGQPMRRQAQVEGVEILKSFQQQGRGVLLVSGHFMTLEMCGRLMCDYAPLSGMYRRHRNPVFEWAVKRGRLRYAERMFTNEEIRAAVRHLKKGGFLWYAPDQDMRGKDTVFAPFFGMPAATITATHQLARLTGCAVVPYFHRREGSRYILRIGEALADFPSDDIAADSARVNAQIEAMVREAPEQYLWVHRRFKRQPQGRSHFYQ